MERRPELEPRERELEAIALAESSATPEDHSARDSFRIVFVYFVLGLVWFYTLDRATVMAGLSTQDRATIGFLSGSAFVLLSSIAGYVIGLVYLGRLHRSQQRYVEAQRALRHKDIAIRQAYVDVLDAVTGGKLVLMTPEEVENVLGPPLLPATAVTDASDVAEARELMGRVLSPLTDRTEDIELAVSEALTNVLKHAGSGTYRISRAGDCIQVIVSDSGPGIDFRTLPKATLLPGFSTKQSLGMGFTIMLNLSDQVLLATEPGKTVVVLEFDLLGTTGGSEIGADRMPSALGA